MSRLIILISIVLLAIIFRIILFFSFRPVLSDGQNVSFSTTVLDEPVLQGRINRITAVYGNIFGSQKLLIYYLPTINILYGEKISITGSVEIIKSKNSSSQSNGLINLNNGFSMYLPKIQPQIDKNNIFLSLASYIRQKTKELYFSNLDDQSANLLLGIVLGVRGSFSQSFLQSLRNAGVMHVIAASGMNVTLTGGLLLGLLGKFFTRKISLAISVCGIVFYAVLAGFQPSIIRAAIMISFVFTSQIFGRQYTSLYGLFFTVLLMLFVSPELLFDIGFLLSVFSTLGILFIKPLFPKTSWFEDASTTISAQIATLPILLSGFGQYGLLSILVNALVLWTVPILMILGGIAAITQFIPFVAGTFLFFTVPLLWFFESIVSAFNSIPLSITFSQVPFLAVVGYYVFTFGVVWFLRVNREDSINIYQNNNKDIIRDLKPDPLIR